jgi:transcriptional regulator with GAF, ATPase, and Fis domain
MPRILLLTLVCLATIDTLGINAFVLTHAYLPVHSLFTLEVHHSDQDVGLPSGHWNVTHLNGHEVKSWPALLRMTSQLPVDSDRVQLTLAGDGETINLPIDVRLPLWRIIGPSLLWLIPKCLLAGVALALFWRTPDEAAPRQFLLLATVSLMAYLGGYHWNRIASTPLLLIPFVTAAVFLPAINLHFNLIFPRAPMWFDRSPVWIAMGIYLPPALYLVTFFGEYWQLRGLELIARDQNDIRYVDESLLRLNLGIRVYLGVAFAYFLAGLAVLVYGLIHAKNAIERNQTKWILYGALASFFPIALSLYFAMFDRQRFAGGLATAFMFAASIAMSVAYSVSMTRYRLMQFDRILSKSLLYFLISALVGTGYNVLVILTVIIVGQGGFHQLSIHQALIGGSAAFLIVMALDLARVRLKRLLDQRFKRDRQRLEETLSQMSVAVNNLVDERQLAESLLRSSMDISQGAQGAVFLCSSVPEKFHVVGATQGWNSASEISAELWSHDSSTSRLEAFLARSSRPYQNSVLISPLMHESRKLGFLAISRPVKGRFSLDEERQLAALCQVAALALHSAEGHRQIDDLSKELQDKVAKIAEQQRRIIALQSQLRLRSRDTSEPIGISEPPSGQLHQSFGLVGDAPPLRRVLDMIRRVAPTNNAVLIRGESGTGKELVAQALHDSSLRAGKPFIKVHCAALSPGLLESELFGHVRGAFTGALKDKVGRFEAANGGTLFLDEIGDISHDIQIKLLRVLQEMTFERVGSSDPVKVDVRIVAATHRNLETMIDDGVFRRDLFFRLNVFPIDMPPLRERIEDIPELVQYFLNRSEPGRVVHGVDDDVLVAFKHHHWPGNIRELEHVLERAIVLGSGPILMLQDLPSEFQDNYLETGMIGTDQPLSGANLSRSARNRKMTMLREQIVQVLSRAGGNKSEAARALAMPRSTLISHMRRLGIS